MLCPSVRRAIRVGDWVVYDHARAVDARCWAQCAVCQSRPGQPTKLWTVRHNDTGNPQ
jgi:hypothetical protein